MPESTTTILIVGAGPVGLWLALELKSAGVDDVLVIDVRKSRDDRDNFSKALAVSAGSLDMLDSRGLATDSYFLDKERGHKVPLAHFGCLETYLQLNKKVLGIRHPYNLAISQARSEEILLERCEVAGVRFGWGLRFRGLEEEEEEKGKEGGVAVVVRAERITTTAEKKEEEEEEIIRASWVVGCDGTHSAVRQAVGIPFEGQPSTVTGLLGDVQFGCDKAKLPGGGKGLGIWRGPWGSSLMAPVGDGVHYRFVGIFKGEGEGEGGSKRKELTMDQLREHLRKVFDGDDLDAHSPLWLSRFGSACRVASTFRSGRVLLAGDAAHQIFPAGGQGMNAGWQDASNLAWKLALVVNGGGKGKDDVERIMDSYTRERLPQIKSLVDNVLTQMGLMVADKPHEEALRGWVRDTLKAPETNALWALRVTGFGDERGPFREEEKEGEGVSRGGGGDDDLVGMRMTHLFPRGGENEEQEGGGGGNLFENTTPRQFVLVIRQEVVDEVCCQDILEEAKRWGDDHLKVLLGPTQSTDERWDGVVAVLVRPDQRVTWVARQVMEGDSMRISLAAALGRWLGKPAS